MINRALAAPFPTWIYLSILTPGVGGLLVGLALHYWVPAPVGSGVPQVKVAYALHAGHVQFRDAIGKFVFGIIQIGSGGSLGREGPTVQICAGISSLLARVFSLSRQSQRRMASVGVAAGIAAAFNAPTAAVIFTLEEIIGDLDQTMRFGIALAIVLVVIVASRAAFAQSLNLEGQKVFSLPPRLFSFKRRRAPQPASGFLSLLKCWTRPGQLPSSVYQYGSLRPGRVRLHRKSPSGWQHGGTKQPVECGFNAVHGKVNLFRERRGGLPALSVGFVARTQVRNVGGVLQGHDTNNQDFYVVATKTITQIRKLPLVFNAGFKVTNASLLGLAGNAPGY